MTLTLIHIASSLTANVQRYKHVLSGAYADTTVFRSDS